MKNNLKIMMSNETFKQYSRKSSLSLNSDSCDFEVEDLTSKACICSHQVFPEFSRQNLRSQYFSEFVAELSSLLKQPFCPSSIDDLAQDLQKLIKSQIDCSLIELTQVITDCYKLIQNFETHNISSTFLNIGNFSFSISISDSDYHVADKSTISKNFVSRSLKCDKKLDLPQSLIDYSNNYELQMEKAFHSDPMKPVPRISPADDSLYLAQLYYYRQKKKNQELVSGHSEIDWNKNDIKFLRSQLKNKKHELDQKGKNISEEYSKLKAERIKIANEHQKLENSWEQLREKKEKQLKLSSLLQNMVQNIIGTTESTHMNSFMSVSSIHSVESSFVEEEDQGSLEAELKELEAQIKAGNSSEQVLMRVNHVKTRLNTIKTERILSQTKQKSSCVRNKLSAIQKVMSMKNVLPPKTLGPNHRNSVQNIVNRAPLHRKTMMPMMGSHNRTSTFTPTNLLEISRDSLTPTPEKMESAHKFEELQMEVPKNLDCSFSEKRRSLVIKEARLQAKEEELVNKEKYIRNNLEKKITDTEYLNLLKTERMNINRVKRELESKEKILEEKYAELENFENGMARNEENLVKQKDDIRAERKKLENDREDLVQKIEEIKSLVHQSLSM